MILDLASKGAVHQVVEQDDQFLSTLFVVKQANKTRPIFNLKTFNNYVHTEKFKLESLDLVKTMLKPNNYLKKLDLKDAYYSVPIAEDHKKYLRFQFQGVTYEYQCLPFGLSSAPRAFTKLLKPVISILRSSGIQVVIYLEDLLLLHQDAAELQGIFQLVSTLLTDLGFIIKLEKCSQSSVQAIIFLGAMLDSEKAVVQRDSEKAVVHHAGTFSTIRSNKSDCQNRDLGSALALSFASTTVHFSLSQERPLHNIPEFQDPPDEASILRARMVVFEPADSGKSFGIDTTNDRHDHIDRCHHVHAIFSY